MAPQKPLPLDSPPPPQRDATPLTLGPVCFYGSARPRYLTPLERKALREDGPPSAAAAAAAAPPPAPPRRRPKRPSVGVVLKLSQADTPRRLSGGGAPPKRARRHLVVGAAFFCSGKKSMFKHSEPKRGTIGRSRKEKESGGGRKDRQQKEKEKERQRKKKQQEEKEKLQQQKRLVHKGKEEEKKKLLHQFDPTDWAEDDTCLLSLKPKQDKKSEKDTSIQADSWPPSDSCSTNESAAVYPIFGTLKKNITVEGACGAPSRQLKERAQRRRKGEQTGEQLIIDAGQSSFGPRACSSCSMVFSADSSEDQFQHQLFHQQTLDAIRVQRWKDERVVAEFSDGKIIMILPGDPKYAVRKAEEVRRVADRELGFQQGALRFFRTYLFVSVKKQVVGCVLAEPIRQAYQMLPPPSWCCSPVPQPALCGVSRVWVFEPMRRKQVATRLLDAVRSSFLFGSILSKQEVAFSDPTPDGRVFAARYCGTPHFLVYNFVP